MNQIIKLGVGIVLAGLLTACGPDGDSGGEEGILNKGGECVDIEHKANKNVKYLHAGQAKSIFFETQTLEFTKSSQYFSVRVIGKGTVDDIREESYVKNHYLHIRKRTDTRKFENGETIGTLITTYSPVPKTPYDRVCKGQTWVDEYSATTTIDNKENEIEMYTKFVIEDINVKKTVKAGEFSTYIMTHYDKEGNLGARIWFDIKTGETVYKENSSGRSIQELVEVIKN